MAEQGYAAPSHAAVSIEADDDEDDLVAIQGSDIVGGQDKGKGRAKDTLAPPSSSSGGAVSGRIGGSGTGVGRKSLRTTIGGLQVETRYTGQNSLDETVSESIVGDNATVPALQEHSG